MKEPMRQDVVYEPNSQWLKDEADGSRYLTVQFFMDEHSSVTDSYDTEELESAYCLAMNQLYHPFRRVIKGWGATRFKTDEERDAFREELKNKINGKVSGTCQED